MDDHRTSEAWSQLAFLPHEVFFIELDLLEELRVSTYLGCGLAFFFVMCYVRSAVLEVEANRQLEVDLHSSALVLSFESIDELDVDLRAVEGAIAFVNLPFLPEGIECFL